MNTPARTGLAIFVKTPGHSPLKTRLAASIGTATACEFHLLSARAVAAVAQSAQTALPRLVPHWAVAEPAALDARLWSSLPRIRQGEGDLGARMRHVADGLCRSLGSALLLGADTPQICVGDLRNAIHALETHQHVLGLSEDGGFWLFATRGNVPAAAWMATPWSQPDTAQRFVDALAGAPIARLRTLRDADTAADLPPLLVALDALPRPLPEQARLADWLRNTIPM